MLHVSCTLHATLTLVAAATLTLVAAATLTFHLKRQTQLHNVLQQRYVGQRGLDRAQVVSGYTRTHSWLKATEWA